MRAAAVVALLLIACAPKRVDESTLPVAPPPPAPIATKLKAPDAGPFDFSQRPEDEKKPFVSGDMSHAGKMPVNVYGR